MLIDISRPVSHGTLLHKGDPPFVHARFSDMSKDGEYNLSLVTMCVHTGSHFDFPLHFDNGAPGVEGFDLERFIVTAHVIDCGAADAVTPEHIDSAPVQRGDAVLLKTRNGTAPQDYMRPGWVYITPEAAQRCVDLGAGIVGADYVEVEQGVDKGEYPVHQTLLGNGVLLLENIDLRPVTAGRYRLYCFPILLSGLEGSPCRAVLETLE
jgi:arylformamidase